ncbi:anti-sigma factor antagonist [Pseudonocardiaceae bacterium YIM PH 21723]|nr:anti-sigma factor antagonist [Pseudonocardiaceae bacterium YIM PH 21723]
MTCTPGICKGPKMGTPEISSAGNGDISLSLRHTGNAIVLTIRGDIDLETAPLFRRHLHTARDIADPHRSLLIDLRDVRFFNSSGIAELITVHEHCRKRGVDLIILADGPAVLRPLQVTGLAEVFDIRSSFDAAPDAGLQG